MQSDYSLESLLVDAMNGCDQAAEEVVRRFDQQLRLEIRTRLAAVHISRLEDSVDIAQSVFRDFLLGLRARKIELREPRQAIALLMQMARRQVVKRTRFHAAEKRDYRRSLYDSNVLKSVPLRGGAGEGADYRDLMCWVKSRVDQLDYTIINYRIDGLNWNEIAEKLDSKPDALRMRMRRVSASVGSELLQRLA